MYNYIVHTRKFDNVGLEVHGSLRDFSHADQETVVGFSIAMTTMHQQEAPVHLSIANTEQNGRFHSDDELPPSPRSVPATDHATDASYW